MIDKITIESLGLTFNLSDGPGLECFYGEYCFKEQSICELVLYLLQHFIIIDLPCEIFQSYSPYIDPSLSLTENGALFYNRFKKSDRETNANLIALPILTSICRIKGMPILDILIKRNDYKRTHDLNTKNQPYICELCPKLHFLDYYSFFNHCKLMHANYLFCPFCLKKFHLSGLYRYSDTAEDIKNRVENELYHFAYHMWDEIWRL